MRQRLVINDLFSFGLPSSSVAARREVAASASSFQKRRGIRIGSAENDVCTVGIKRA